ncbi:MAG TPA: GNAT family N-acetyltransferase [Bryobacteraceae bacterium]|jgi:ribosomal protein S18 acetylase RimI-like enzyme|nr:GNAT family N-acetyltransferase [Bryobacteraceae bacterium]
MSDFLTIDGNLRAAMRFFGEASGSGEVRELDGSIAIFSGLDYGVFNIALLTSPARGGQLQPRLEDVAKFFRERTLRWSFWLCDDLLDPAAARRERQTFLNYGMRVISHPPGMLAEALAPPARQLPEIECRPVCDAQSRAAFAELTSISFDIPYMIARAVYTREQAWRGDYRGFVGVTQGQVVATVAMVAAGDAIGVYSLATVPAFRRRGYGEALLRAAALEMTARTGLRRLVLQSTEAGYSLYRRMGFRDVTKFTVYLTK